MVTPAIILSFALVFLEVIKEMPITLMLRPYGVNTFATKIYEFTSEGEWEQAAAFSIVMILLGFLGLVLSQLTGGLPRKSI